MASRSDGLWQFCPIQPSFFLCVHSDLGGEKLLRRFQLLKSLPQLFQGIHFLVPLQLEH